MDTHGTRDTRVLEHSRTQEIQEYLNTRGTRDTRVLEHSRTQEIQEYLNTHGHKRYKST